MNQVQLLKGYVAMGKTDKLKAVLKNVETTAIEERKLFASGAQAFAFWLLSFNSTYDSFRLQYRLEAEVDLSNDDEWLVSHAHDIMDYLSVRTEEWELYEGELLIKENSLRWTWKGVFKPGRTEEDIGTVSESENEVTITKDWNK